MFESTSIDSEGEIEIDSNKELSEINYKIF